MSLQDSISVWIGALKCGDHDAARKLWGCYSVRLARLAETRLPVELRAYVCGEDVANRAFHEVIAGLLDGRFPKLTDRDGFWKLLAHVTICRAINEVRNARCPVGREELVEWIPGQALAPDLLVMVADDFEALLNRLDARDPDGSSDLRAIAVGLYAGYTLTELALRLGCSRSRVVRKHEIIKKVLQPGV